MSLEGLAITMGLALAVMLGGGIVSRVAMATARRRMRHDGVLKRLQAEDPTPATVWALTHESDASGPFRVAYTAYRVGTAARVVFYGLGVLVAVGVLGAAIAYGQRGDVIGSRGIDWLLAIGAAMVVAYAFTLLGTRAAQALSVWRRSGDFPEGLTYAHLVSQRVSSDWRKVPPPRTDAFADLYERWSGRLEHAAVRLAPPMVFLGLLAGIVHFLGRT